MFNTPIDAIAIQDIEQALKSGVREGTLLEFKGQFPNKLEKVISSMANTFGGMILIGVEETTTGGGSVPVKGIPLGPGLRERVIEIGLNAIYPPLIPEVRVVEFKSDPALATDDRAVVVIRVHESEEGGHAVDQRTAVYVRADNVSARMRKATVEEIEWFLQKRQKSLSEKTRIIQQAQQRARQFLIRLRQQYHISTAEPKGRFIISTVPAFPRSPIATPKELYEFTKTQVRNNLSIAPGAFPYGRPHRILDGIYWAQDDSREYYYTEIQQQGLLYSEFEFHWDKQTGGLFLPEVAATLLWIAGGFAMTVYQHFGYFGLFDLRMGLSGVRDRHIHPALVTGFMGPQMMDDVIEVTARISGASSEQELLFKSKEMIRETYWAFGWDVKSDRLEAHFK